MRRWLIYYCNFVLVALLLFCSKTGPDQLVEVRKLDPTIRVELVYATPNNFLGRAVYSDSRCFLRRSVAERLVRAQKRLLAQGYTLKIWDGYRPLSVQKEMWKILPDANFVADPSKGSRHNRGAAVDLTMVDAMGKEVEMPTPFDDFTIKAASHYSNVSELAKKHRQILQEAMQAEGFLIYDVEWWHFNDPQAEKFEILDIDSKKL